METSDQGTGEHEEERSEDSGRLEELKDAAREEFEQFHDDSQHSDAPGASGTDDLDTPRAPREGRD